MVLLKKLFGAEKEPEVAFFQVTDENFAGEVLKASNPVMLFIWSGTCPHCKKMLPNVKTVGNRYAQSLKSAHTNMEMAPRALASLNIRGVPAVLFFHQGKVVEHVAGFRPESYLDELVQAHFVSHSEHPETAL